MVVGSSVLSLAGRRVGAAGVVRAADVGIGRILVLVAGGSAGSGRHVAAVRLT